MNIIPNIVQATQIENTTIITAMITLLRVLSIDEVFNDDCLN